MVYNPSIPQPGDRISMSQAQLLENFGQLNSQFSVDHDSLVSPADGFHKIIHFTNQGSDVISSNPQLYTKTGTGPNGVATEQLKYAPTTNPTDNPAFPLSVLPVRACGIITPGASPTLSGAYNMTAVSRVSAGIYTVTISNAPSSMKIFPVCTVFATSGVGWVSWFQTINNTTLKVVTGTNSPFTATDPNLIYLTVFGG